MADNAIDRTSRALDLIPYIVEHPGINFLMRLVPRKVRFHRYSILFLCADCLDIPIWNL